MAARTRTLAQLREDVLWQADRQGTTLRNAPAQVDRAINQSIAEFREAVSEAGNPYFLTKQTGSLPTGATSPYHFGTIDLSALSPAHMRVYGLDIQVQNAWLSLDPAMFRERNDQQSTLVGGGAIPRLFFEFDRTTVAFAPASDTAYSYLLFYLPVHADLSADGDTFDGINGYGEDWVIFNTVSRLLLRDRDAHLERFEAERKRILDRVLHVGRQRQRAGAMVRGGVTNADRWGSGRGHPFPGQGGSGLNPPGLAQAGRVALATNSGTIDWRAGTNRGDKLEWGGSAWFQRRGWITPDIDLTGVEDATPELQACIDAARFGQCVWLPEGKIRLNSGLEMRRGVTLAGTATNHRHGPFQNNNDMAAAGYCGATFYVYGTGVGITMELQSSLVDVAAFYPNQTRTTASFTAYDYFIDVPGGCHGVTLQNIAPINAYKGIRVGGDAAVGGVRIDNIRGLPLDVGIYLGRVSDQARISNVNYNIANHYEYNATFWAEIAASAQAFIIDGAESFMLSSILCSRLNRGITFRDLDADGFFGTYGEIVNSSFDRCTAGVVILDRSLTARGLGMSNCEIIPGSTGNGILWQDLTGAAAGFDAHPSVYASNLRFWGVNSRCVHIPATSAGRFTMTGGKAVGSTNELFRNNSTEAGNMLMLQGVTSASGATRTGGAGTIYDDVSTYPNLVV